MELKTKKRATKIIQSILALLVVAIILFPIVWMLPAAFKETSEIFSVPNTFLPKNWTLENFEKVFSLDHNGYSFVSSLISTFLVATIAVVASLTVNMLAAYAFARLDFPFKNFIWWYILITMFIPGITILLTSIQVVNRLHMIDTIWVLIIPGVASAYNIFYFRQFFLGIPSSLEDAALIDGLGRFGIFTKIYIPMSKTPMIVISVSVFIAYWNSFMWPTLTVTNNPRIAQIMQLIRELNSTFAGDFGIVIAASLLAILIPLVLFAIFQRKIVEGIATTGMK